MENLNTEIGIMVMLIQWNHDYVNALILHNLNYYTQLTS